MSKTVDVRAAAVPEASRELPRVRRESRVVPPPRHPQWLLNQLPVGMLQSDFFVRFVSIFQALVPGVLARLVGAYGYRPGVHD